MSVVLGASPVDTADSVDPEDLLAAFMIVTDGDAPNESALERLAGTDMAAILERIGRIPAVTGDLFRRCCAMVNFFAVESNRRQVAVDGSRLEPDIWLAAATAPVHHVASGDAAGDTFDPWEFVVAARINWSSGC